MEPFSTVQEAENAVNSFREVANIRSLSGTNVPSVIVCAEAKSQGEKKNLTTEKRISNNKLLTTNYVDYR